MGFEYRSDTRPLSELALALVEKQPDYLFCNGITLRLLAKEFLDGKYPKVEIEQLLVVSDPVSQEFRDLMKAAFGARTIDRYSSEEFGLFGLQCPVEDHFHIVTPDFILEVLDENNQPVPDGGQGRAVITGLANRAMPLVRYEMGDIVKTGSACSAGITWPIVTEISGRTRDFVTWPDGTTTIATFVMSPILYLSDLYDYSCILFTDTILFVAGIKEPLSETSIETINTELLRIFGPGKQILIQETSILPIMRMHKRPEFFRRDEAYSPDFDPFEQVFNKT
jgi:phenylacetate-CoA ligase